jgi:hypothetical protein
MGGQIHMQPLWLLRGEHPVAIWILMGAFAHSRAHDAGAVRHYDTL